MPFSQSLLPEFDAEMKNTRKILECVPDGKLDYQPHPKSMTLGRLATHVAELPTWTNITIDQDVLDMQPGYKPHIAQSRAELLEIFDKAVAEARAKIEATSDEHWQKIWTFKFAGNTVLSMPRAAVMRSVIMNHMIHHRAQLGVFLRLNDVAIPGMYGPSADESVFAAAG
ncbi:MAG: DinB family protein [Bryobacteraceae bacterium]